jgi:hypothetical protein
LDLRNHHKSNYELGTRLDLQLILDKAKLISWLEVVVLLQS